MILKVKFTEVTKNIPVKLTVRGSTLSVNMGEIHNVTEYIGGEEYKGAYEVTPKVEGQTMPTKDKVLIDDMTIKAIPFYKVSNTSGGNTVFIGNEV